MTKILIIDIDGVLYTSDHFKWLCSKRKPTKDKYGFIFDPTCVKRFNKIIRKTGAKIVISSSWRSSGIKVMIQCFIDRGVKGEIIGLTPVGTLNKLYFKRSDEIKDWLKDNGTPDRLAIIDDVDLSKYFDDFYKTKMSTGITEKLMNEIIKNFNS